MSWFRYLPVEVVNAPAKGDVFVVPKDRGMGIWVDRETLKDVDHIKAEGAEEYHETLIEIIQMPVSMREDIFGKSMTLEGYVNDFPPLDLVKRRREFKNTPRVGEYWKNDKYVVLVRNVDIEKHIVKIYHCKSGNSDGYLLEAFIKEFINTGITSNTLDNFQKEMMVIANA